jgi:short-subunit dehydrogenase
VYENMLALNVTALTTLTTRFVPAIMQRRQSHILNVGSLAAFLSFIVPEVSFANSITKLPPVQPL